MTFCVDPAFCRSLMRPAGVGMIAVLRQVWFWLATAVAIVLALWLLHGILLPFVAGMALAYLLDPFANRLERLGLKRALRRYLASRVYTGAPSDSPDARAIADAGPKLGSS
jgi:hypothetical protein